MSEINPSEEIVSGNKRDLFLKVEDGADHNLIRTAELFESMAVLRNWSLKWQEAVEVGPLDESQEIEMLKQAKMVGYMYVDFRTWFGSNSNENGAYEGYMKSKKEIVDSLGDKWKYPEDAQLINSSDITIDSGNSLHKLRHDIGNPINVIQGFAMLIGEDRNDPYRSSNLSNILEAVSRLDSVVSEGVDFIRSRFLGEQESLNVMPTEHISSAVEDAFRKMLPTQLILLTGDRTGQQPSISVASIKDASIEWSWKWLDFLLENLASNIAKAYVARSKKEPEFDEQLKVSVGFVAQSTEEGDFVDMIVEDNGIGYPDKIIENGFGDAETDWQNSELGGTGYGMSTLEANLPEGGKFIPGKRKDKKGNIIPGGSLVARLPRVS